MCPRGHRVQGRYGRGGGCVDFDTGFWDGMGEFRVSGKGFLTGVHARFVGCPY